MHAKLLNSLRISYIIVSNWLDMEISEYVAVQIMWLQKEEIIREKKKRQMRNGLTGTWRQT